MESSVGQMPALPSSAELPNNQVQQIIALKVMKEQMDSQKEMVAQLLAPASGTYARDGGAASASLGTTIDVRM